MLRESIAISLILSYPKDQVLKIVIFVTLPLLFVFISPNSPPPKTGSLQQCVWMSQILHLKDWRSILHCSIHLFIHLLNYPALSELQLLKLIWLWSGDLLRLSLWLLLCWVLWRVRKEEEHGPGLQISTTPSLKFSASRVGSTHFGCQLCPLSIMYLGTNYLFGPRFPHLSWLLLTQWLFWELSSYK